MPTVVITGANRGLGLEFAKQYSQEGWKVIASCRSPEKALELSDLDVEIHSLDVSDPEEITRFGEILKGETVDLLINNAGIHDSHQAKNLDSLIDPNHWIQGFKVNVMAPVLLTKALLPNLSLSKKPVATTIGSQAGCLSLYKSGGLYMYRTTKSAAHSAGVCLANDLREKGVIYVVVRPGRTKTDMGGGDAPYELDDTITNLRSVFANATMEQSGKFIDRDGRILPWLPEKNQNPGQ